MSAVIALYPGSFDPITNGHLDVVTRAAKIFEKVVVGVYKIPNKDLLFSSEERTELGKLACAHLSNVEVVSFDGIMIDFAQKIGARVIVRGLRAGADFEYEFNMAMMNKNLAPNLEMIFFITNLNYQFVSSSLLKEVANLGGDVSNLVPPPVLEALRKKISQGKL